MTLIAVSNRFPLKPKYLAMVAVEALACQATDIFEFNLR